MGRGVAKAGARALTRRRRIDPRRIKIHRSYFVEELARALGCHKNSVRNMIKEGLPVLDDGKRPVLISGRDARTFLEARRRRTKRRCQVHELYCLRCREPRAPAAAMADFDVSNQSTAMLSALCCECGTMMFKRVRVGDRDRLSRVLQLQILAGLRTLKKAA